MRTVITTDPDEAAEFIKNGGVVAFPTETVYGLGANVFDAAAVAAIFEAKRRPGDNPLIAHISSRGQIKELAAEITEDAERFIDVFFPGPLTVVLKKKAVVPKVATAGLETIGVRMPGNEVAREFLSSCGMPVAAPSANISGRPSPTTWEAVYEDLDGCIDCILRGGATEIGLESTVVDCTGRVPVLLRSGAVSIEELRAVVSATRIYQATDVDLSRSPGMRHKHYSPRARVVLIDGGIRIAELEERIQSHPPSQAGCPIEGPGPLPVLTAAYIGLSRPNRSFEIERICGSVGEYAHSLFEFFRKCDREDIETIYCENVAETGIGVALMDRLRRAAE